MRKNVSIFLLLFCHLAWAQKVSFVCSSNAEKINNAQYRTYLGDYFEINFMLNNGVGKNFVAPKFKDFNVLSGPNAYNVEQITNNVRQSKYGYTYTLQPKKSGRFLIEPASITHDNQVLQSNPIAIEVVKDESSGKNEKALPIVLRIKTDKDNYYVGEQINLRYQVLSLVPIRDFEVLQQPELKDFIVQNIQQESEPSRERFRGKTYQVFTVQQKILFAQKSGNVNLEPIAANLMVEVEEKGASLGLSSTKVVAAESEALTLRIKDLPATLLTDFSGAVGTWQLAMNSNKNDITTDETLAIQLEISGNGDPKRIVLPKLKLSDSLEVYEPKIIEEGIGPNEAGEATCFKKVEYLIVPKYAGKYNIQPVFTYFDTESDDFSTIKTSPMLLNVTQGSGKITPEIGAQTPTEPTSFWQKNKKYVWLLSAILSLIALLYYFFRRKKTSTASVENEFVPSEKTIENTVAVEKGKTDFLAIAEKNLNEYDTENFYKNTHAALMDWLKNNYKLDKNEVSESNLEEKMQTLGANSNNAATAATILAACNKARFAAATDIENARQVLAKLKSLS